MTISDLAARLKCALWLRYEPEMEDPQEPFKFIPNPLPWTVQKFQSYDNNRGRGATPDEACDAFAASLIESARKRLKSDSESQSSAAQYLIDLESRIGKGY